MKMNSSGSFQDEYDRCRELVDRRLNDFFINNGENYAELLESMRYSLLAGGKRVRAVVCLKFCEAAGGDPLRALDPACAIEMMHTYSLIHDDLPCMDDDEVRRGKPSNHVAFGEYTATLAGDALQAAAFETLLKSELQAERLVLSARILAEAAGAHGICGGQFLDISAEGKQISQEDLMSIHNSKTAAMFSAAAQIGVTAAGGTHGQMQAAGRYAISVGLAFQIRDDVLDLTSTTGELGKPAGSDVENLKITFAALLGQENCENRINAETKKAIAALDDNFGDTSFLTWFARTLAERKY